MPPWTKLPKPIIGLAPMADYTDQPFTLICKQFGAQIIFREMISAEAMVRGNKKTLKMLAIDKKERPVIQQIFGREPKIMAEAAKIICRLAEPDGIDINMGCPARKLVKNFHGAALMKESPLAAEIVKAVKESVKVPVSVKTRLGWSRPEEILVFAPLLEKAGADGLTIHGRTKEQGYAGAADWEMIGQVKKILKIPVLANGGIFTTADLEQCLKITKADGVLIARGALGNPWIFQNKKPALKERIATVLNHACLEQKYYGDYGMILFRKHLMHYFKGLPGAKNLKVNLGQIKKLKELEIVLKLL